MDTINGKMKEQRLLPRQWGSPGKWQPIRSKMAGEMKSIYTQRTCEPRPHVW